MKGQCYLWGYISPVGIGLLIVEIVTPGDFVILLFSF